MAAKLLFILNDHNLQGAGRRDAIRNLVANGTRLIRVDLIEDPVVFSDAIWVTDNFNTGNCIALGFVRERTTVLIGIFTRLTLIVIAAEDGSCVTCWHYLRLSRACGFHFAAMRARPRQIEGGRLILEVRSARLTTGTRHLKRAFHWFAIALGTIPEATLW